MASGPAIQLRGVQVHNLKSLDLDIPRNRLVVLCGVSGSGKSSLALDTLYAEGQRRYIESFSAYTRQFLQRLEKPAAERIDGIPPAIAVTQAQSSRSGRSTVGTLTEAADYLRLLLARVGQVTCRHCGRPVRRETPQQVASLIAALPPGTRLLVTFDPALGDRADNASPRNLAANGSHRQSTSSAEAALAAGADEQHEAGLFPTTAQLREQGFQRLLLGERLLDLSTASPDELMAADATLADPAHLTLVVVDRLTASTPLERITDSLETAFRHGQGQLQVWCEEDTPLASTDWPRGTTHTVEGRTWRKAGFSREFRCDDCGQTYPELEPRLFSFNSPLGACPRCEGFGSIMEINADLVVPDPAKSLREGAIAPWNTPAYAHELQELLALADDYQIDVDCPYAQLPEDSRRLVWEGVPDRQFGGLRGFFLWLQKRKYKMHLRVFYSRWRSSRICPDCGGARLRPEALDARLAGSNIAELSALEIGQLLKQVNRLQLPPTEATLARTALEQLRQRLDYLVQVGLAYLTLDRPLKTLSGGELQRVALTTALGSSLVNMLYVLDEPSVGLHPHDTDRLVRVIRRLCDRRNSVIVVEHEEAMLRAADQVIEIGPGAGERGGKVVFQGTPQEMQHDTRSLTGDYLAGRRGLRIPQRRRVPNHGWIRLAGARGHNLQNLTVEFPLGLLCVVTGVSGSGKSTLVEETLYPALCRRLHKTTLPSSPYDDVFGDGQLEDVVLVDQSPIGRSPRSNPVTYLKAFDEIRAVFAETVEARTHNYTASHFSFNGAQGRCPVCEGDGHLQVDMQFLADIFVRCGECQGTRYRPEILEVTYRGASIADVLEMTVREAFTFFRGRPKVQARLKRLIDVGLDYLRLGQPANTLSGGEAQRLKLAGYLAGARRARTLFVLDEPTTGLHFADVVQLMDCFEALLAVGHSLIVVEHNLQLIKCADYLIDLGPGAAAQGGRVVVQGTPEQVARHPDSLTGRYLAEVLRAEMAEQPA